MSWIKDVNDDLYDPSYTDMASSNWPRISTLKRSRKFSSGGGLDRLITKKRDLKRSTTHKQKPKGGADYIKSRVRKSD
jgi:hypothetical protein